jgi:hypothetical protein
MVLRRNYSVFRELPIIFQSLVADLRRQSIGGPEYRHSTQQVIVPE